VLDLTTLSLAHRRAPARHWALLALLVAALLGVYSNHFANDFHFDDWHTIQQNPAIHEPANIPRLFTDARTFSILPDHQEYRPVASTSLAIDYWLAGGLKPFWFHLSTFLWYLLQLALMYALFSRFAGDTAALAATALYALHPVSAETLNYIVQRADLYSTLGIVAGLFLYLRYPNLRRHHLYLLPVALGALAKVQAVMFAPLLTAYVFLFEECNAPGAWRRVFERTRPAWAVCGALFVFTRIMTSPSATLGGGGFAAYLASQPGAILYYFSRFFMPIGLSADSGWQPGRPVLDEETVMGLLLLCALGLAIYLCARIQAARPVAFGLAWFLIGLAPGSLVPLAECRNDHRMFLPFVGLTLVVGCSAVALARRWLTLRIAVPAAVCLLAAFGWLTIERNRVWHTEESLWRDVTLKSPRNGRGWMNYGLAQSSRGDYTGALAAFEQARLYTPDYPLLEINFGIVRGAKGDHQAAESHFRRALQLAPRDAQPMFYYARWLHARARAAEALPLLEAAARANPGWPEPRRLLDTVRAADTPERLVNESLAHYRAHRYREAVAAARRAVTLKPGSPEAYNNIGAALNEMGLWDEAIVNLNVALRLRPDFQLARNNLAWAERQRKRAVAAPAGSRPIARVLPVIGPGATR
jgi:protein O-mannosyl-transferase